MFGWGKRGKNPAPASGGAGEVAVKKVDRIEFDSLVKPPPRFGAGGIISAANPRNPAALPPAVTGTAAARMHDGSPREDINRKASRFIEDTKKRWQLAHKSFRATGTGR